MVISRSIPGEVTMKILGLFLLTAVLALGAVGQAKPKGVDVEYDKFKDETRVEMYVGRAWNGIRLAYEFEGSKLDSAVETFQFIYSYECRTRYCFHDYDEIIFLIDGERLIKTKPIYPTIGADTIVFELSRAELTRLAGAKQVEFKVASLERTINAKDLSKIQTLLDYSKP